ncbi:hypothetical protein [Devriesea agamarum]|uniref:hypothetical protein n=1 Tax=Devriesea agamarum TaxID=472569 RepID=UPI00071C64D0|nr:hypothetical protein [Devriesea agamarum]
MSIEESFLRCTVCDRVADHVVIYAGRLVTEIKCTGCGAITRLDVSEEYLPDLGDRIRTKPRRLWRRLRRDPGELATSLPRRTLSKPWRMVGEFWAVWRGRRRR